MLKNDWQLFSGKGMNAIRDANFTIIVSDVEDYHTAKKLLRSREMYELMEKLVIFKLRGEPIDTILADIVLLKKEIDKS